jgi:hypothetical protein
MGKEGGQGQGKLQKEGGVDECKLIPFPEERLSSTRRRNKTSRESSGECTETSHG